MAYNNNDYNVVNICQGILLGLRRMKESKLGSASQFECEESAELF
jgi:hypothetical protein